MIATTIIVIYNELKNIEIIYNQILKSNLPNHNFLIFDNGSTDKQMVDFVRKIGGNKVIKTFRSEKNLGFGGGVVFAANLCESEYIGWMPGNLKVSIPDLEKFYSTLDLAPNHFIKARRVRSRKRDHFKTLVAGILQSLISGYNLIDTGGTPTYCHRDFFKTMVSPTPPDDVSFETYALYLAHKNNYRIIRPRIYYGLRMFGKSHWQKGIVSEIKLLLRLIGIIRVLKKNKKSY